VSVTLHFTGGKYNKCFVTIYITAYHGSLHYTQLLTPGISNSKCSNQLPRAKWDHL